MAGFLPVKLMRSDICETELRHRPHIVFCDDAYVRVWLLLTGQQQRTPYPKEMQPAIGKAVEQAAAIRKELSAHEHACKTA